MTMTFGQTKDALQAAIQAVQPDDDTSHWVWVADFTDTYVIYELGYDEYFQDDYSIDDDGVVTMAGKPVPVMPQTSYVPLAADSAGIERRGRGSSRSGRPPEGPKDQVRVKSEPFTYRPDLPISFFRDLAVSRNLVAPRGGETHRLARHGREMNVSREARARASRRRFESAFEYRVEPNTNPGTGGNFAPPWWLNQEFATYPRTKRVLAALIEAHFDLPGGVSSVNLPILTTGTRVAPARTGAAVIDRDITDAKGSSTVMTLAGQADTSIQDLEQSPPGAYLDWALFKDMTEDYDSQLEEQLLIGLGAAQKQLVGLANVATIVKITYTAATPTGKAMYPNFGKAAAQIGDGRKQPPECWLMRTARYAWLMASEDSSTRPLMTPDPVIGVASILGWPVFLDDTIPTKLGAGANQDEAFGVRPSDLILLEGEPQTNVYKDVLSGVLGVRFQMHAPVAAITNRYPSGIALLQGTGFVIQAGE